MCAVSRPPPGPVTSEPLSVDEALAAVARSRGRAAPACSSGTVRDHSDAGDVTGLTYEAWDELAVRRLSEIGEELRGRGRFAASRSCTAPASSRSGRRAW